MSHFKERADKTCLNCGTQVAGKYCQQCGQENIEPKIGVGHFIRHFFNDVTHFDGKFFVTIKLLVLRPGYLSSEFMEGRRMSYLDPVRMYLFISALFFVLLFSFTGFKHVDFNTIGGHDNLTPEERTQIADSIKAAVQNNPKIVKHIGNPHDSSSHKKLTLGIDAKYQKGQAYYDSLQRTLPLEERDGFIGRYFAKRQIAMYQAYERDPDDFWNKGLNDFLHSLSKVAFLTMPFFAIFLQLLYVRRRKKYYFVSHLIFTLHVYCVTFLWMICCIFLNFLPDSIGSWPWIVIFLLIIGYLYVAMLRFYQQGKFKTFIKFSLLTFVSFFMLVFLTSLLLFNSFLSIGSAH